MNQERPENPSGAKSGKFSETKHLVFVYGTLKQNEPNHDLLRHGMADFVSVGRTVQKWPLVIASRYNIPYLLYCEGVGKHVIGEIYKVDDEMLSSMDDFECHPKYYTRHPVAVECSDGTLRPWVYFLKNYKAHLLELPVIENYSSKGSHGLEYVSRYKRPPAEEYYYEVQNVLN